MSYALILSILALATPAYAGDEVAWEDDFDVATLRRGDVELTERRGDADFAPAEDDEEEPPEDEPDEVIDDVPSTVARRTGAPSGTGTSAIVGDDFQFDEPAEATIAVDVSKMPGPVALDVAGKEPLADNYAATVVAVDRDAVVIELPVLVAKSRIGNDVPFVLIAEFYAGSTRVAEVRQAFAPASLAEFGPTFAFLKAAAPVVDAKGDVRVVVSKAAADGTGAAPLFTRTVSYALR